MRLADRLEGEVTERLQAFERQGARPNSSLAAKPSIRDQSNDGAFPIEYKLEQTVLKPKSRWVTAHAEHLEASQVKWGRDWRATAQPLMHALSSWSFSFHDAACLPHNKALSAMSAHLKTSYNN